MESQNFEMLRARWPFLADLGGFAERYLQDDPSSSLVKLRSYIEEMLSWIYDAAGFEKPFQANLYELLQGEELKERVEPVVLDKFHQIRLLGNQAAHGKKAKTGEAGLALREAYDLGCWLYITAGAGTAENCPEFSIPRESIDSSTILATKEAELEQLLVRLRQEGQRASEAEAELKELKRLGASATRDLAFSEDETRKRLIDVQLASVGWDLDNANEVAQEFPVPHQPTSTGMGRADYVLRDDSGKPLGVIEAKKTAKDATVGKCQARIYADGLEKEYGQRPVIFYTNGFETFVWDDHPSQGYAPRKIYGFYSKDSLQYLVQQRTLKKPLESVELDMAIANRNYQLGAIRNAFDGFLSKKRNALFVLATGTGKTRVAVSMAEALGRARWSKRILFLCDRLELRKQAKNTFREYLKEPLVEVTASTYKQRDKRIFLATYPAMLKVYQTFDVGFFDLIIADESHRSIYNVYRDIFRYFDCLQVGLTATPRESISHNTFELFGCSAQDPTAYYPYDQGVKDGHLVPFELFTHTTKFLREGIKYKDLTEEQRKQLEEEGIDPESFEYESQQIDKQIYNKDTNRMILRNLMENGIRGLGGQTPGKSIVFARNHRHAVLLTELFDELYPQYGGKFCQVIDNYDPRAEQLIDDFKDPDNELTIAISVDMLDTGIDVPEVVNLSFAKPIRSYVKFWQMIGRGTRLCPDLFGLGLDKQVFRIFDHWGNFEFFEENAKEAEPGMKKALMQLLFEARIALAETCLDKAEMNYFKVVADLLLKDVAELPETSIAVRDKWRQKRSVEQEGVIAQFSANTVQVLRQDIAPLMQWVNIRGRFDAKLFDCHVAQMQAEYLKQSSAFDDFRASLENQVALLPMTLKPVQEKAYIIKEIKNGAYWDDVDFAKLEILRKELRGIMKYKQVPKEEPAPIPVVDISDSGEKFQRRKTSLTSTEMEAYKRRIHAVLKPLFDDLPTLKKIRAAEPVTEEDIRTLVSTILTNHPGVDLNVLEEFYPTVALDDILRSIIGMEYEAVEKKFSTFMAQYHLTPLQNHFLMTLQRTISNTGAIKVAQLYDAPFTSLHTEGLDGVFEDESQIQELLSIIETFDPEIHGETERV